MPFLWWWGEKWVPQVSGGWVGNPAPSHTPPVVPDSVLGSRDASQILWKGILTQTKALSMVSAGAEVCTLLTPAAPQPWP